MVYRIRYGYEPLSEFINTDVGKLITKNALESPELREQMKKLKNPIDMKTEMQEIDRPHPKSFPTVETYHHIVTGQPIPPTVFSTKEPGNP